MAEIWTMGETLVEIMRTKEDAPLNEAALFKGPYPSGSSAIMISTAARLGHSCGIISGVGEDDFGKCILDRLNRDGVDTSHMIVDPDSSTACAFVSYAHDGSRKYLFHWDHTPATEAKMPDVTKPCFTEAKFLHVMGCALTAKLEYGWEIVNTVKAMKRQGTKISFDPNVRVEHLTNPSKKNESYAIIRAILAETNVFEPGIDELQLLTGETEIDAAVKKCFENPNCEILLLKMGSKGSRVYTRDGEIIEQGPYRVKPVDSTGAGDSSDGAFLCGLLEGKPLKQCAQMAAAAGALNVAAFGPMEGEINQASIQAMMDGTYTS